MKTQNKRQKNREISAYFLFMQTANCYHSHAVSSFFVISKPYSQYQLHKYTYLTKGKEAVSKHDTDNVSLCTITYKDAGTYAIS